MGLSTQYIKSQVYLLLPYLAECLQKQIAQFPSLKVWLMPLRQGCLRDIMSHSKYMDLNDSVSSSEQAVASAKSDTLDLPAGVGRRLYESDDTMVAVRDEDSDGRSCAVA